MTKKKAGTKRAATVGDLSVREGSEVKAGKAKGDSWFVALAKALGESADKAASKL